MTAPSRSVRLHGARTNNLRNVDVEIPLDRCTVVLGPSGSGKSSLAFGTLHAAAHSAYLEGISSYARFMESRLTQPDVDNIEGLRPSIALGQGYGVRSSRSTVGTATEALSLMRLLFSRLGEPRLNAGSLSFSHPDGVCPTCEGRGLAVTPIVDLLLDWSKTLEEGAIRHRTWKPKGRLWNIMAAAGGARTDVPARDLRPDEIDFILYRPPTEVSNRGAGFIQKVTHEGVISRIQRRMRDKRELSRAYDLTFFDEKPCPDCLGTRLNPVAMNVRIGDVTLGDVLGQDLTQVRDFAASISNPVAEPVTRRLVSLLDRVLGMGLGYLTLSRGTNTLSGGELQRLKIAHEVSSPLIGLIYVIDEASAGLHYEESKTVYSILRGIVDRGNTVVLVDHAEPALLVSDHVIELGPGGGTGGGNITWSGPASKYRGVHGRLPRLERERTPVDANDTWFDVTAHSHNLHPATVRLPDARFIVLAGPSGSGKSSLATDIATQRDRAALLSQRDIGSTPRSIIATYLGVFDTIRKLFADASGRSMSDFTFNGGGACPGCGGWGIRRIEMQFLEDVVEVCDECEGRRFAPAVLSAKYSGLDISQVLALTIDDAAEVFDQPSITRALDVARAVGMGHLVLGQGSDTLSGGEAQRLRISTEVSGRSHTLLILDEPSRGLGYEEVTRFVNLVDTLLGEGRTVIAIEHHLSLIAVADWVIELGPGSGALGGQVVAQGPPEAIVAARTLTGRALADFDSKARVR